MTAQSCFPFGDGYVTHESGSFQFSPTPSGGGTAFTAAGDLSGSSSTQTVIGLQGHPVSSTAPTANKVLEYNGSSWTPTALPAALPPNGSAGGDLGGTYPSPTVVGLQGRSVSSVSPTTNQVLEWNGSAWVPTTLASAGVAVYNYSTLGSITISAINTPYNIPLTQITALNSSVGSGANNYKLTLSQSAVVQIEVALNGTYSTSESAGDRLHFILNINGTQNYYLTTTIVADDNANNWFNANISFLYSATSGDIISLTGQDANTASGGNLSFTLGSIVVASIGTGSGGGSVSWNNDLLTSNNTNQYVTNISGGSTPGTVTVTSPTMAFQQASTIETTTGNLTITANGQMELEFNTYLKLLSGSLVAIFGNETGDSGYANAFGIPVGGVQGVSPLVFDSTHITLTNGGTNVLDANGAYNRIIVFNSINLTSTTTCTLPAVRTDWILDLTAVSQSGGGSLAFNPGTHEGNTLTPGKVYLVYTTGGSDLGSFWYVAMGDA